MANRLTVNIGGQTFHLVADETVEYMSKIARTADQKIKEACKETGSNTFSAGVLAVLNIADDAVKAQEELSALRERYAALEEGMLATQEKLDALTAEVETLRAENEKLSKNTNDQPKTNNQNQKRKKK